MQTEGGDFPALILFLDKMVLTILSCESFAGRQLLKQQPNKTVFNRLVSNVFLDQRPERILGKRVRHGNGVGVASVRPDGQTVCAVVTLEGHGVAGDFQRFLLGVYSKITGIILRSGGFAVA